MKFLQLANNRLIATLSFTLMLMPTFVTSSQAATPYTQSCVRSVWDSTGLNYPQANEVCENATSTTSSCVINLWNSSNRPFISDIIARCR